MSSDDVRPATDAELAEYRKLCSAEMRAVLARLDAAERERQQFYAEREAEREAREAAEADAAYQRARADALVRRLDFVERNNRLCDQTLLHNAQLLGRWPADRPAGWVKEG